STAIPKKAIFVVSNSEYTFRKWGSWAIQGEHHVPQKSIKRYLPLKLTNLISLLVIISFPWNGIADIPFCVPYKTLFAFSRLKAILLKSTPSFLYFLPSTVRY